MSNILGCSPAKNFSLKGKPYFMVLFKRPSADENNQLSNFQFEKSLIKHLIYFNEQNIEKKMLLICDELLSSTSEDISAKSFSGNNGIKELIKNRKDINYNLILSTHHKKLIEEITGQNDSTVGSF